MTGSCTVPCPSAMWFITVQSVHGLCHLPSGRSHGDSWPVPMLQCLWSSGQYFNSVASKHRAGILAGLLQYTIKILNFFCFQKLNRMATPRGHSNSRQHMDSTWRMYADMSLGLPTALQRSTTGLLGFTVKLTIRRYPLRSHSHQTVPGTSRFLCGLRIQHYEELWCPHHSVGLGHQPVTPIEMVSESPQFPPHQLSLLTGFLGSRKQKLCWYFKNHNWNIEEPRKLSRKAPEIGQTAQPN